MNRNKLMISVVGILLAGMYLPSQAQQRTIKKLERKGTGISVFRPGKRVQKDTTVVSAAKFTTFTDKDGKEKTVVESTKEEREAGIATTIALDGITVVSKSRQVAERNGQVNIDFVVSVPKEMFRKNRLVDIQPRLTRQGDLSTVMLEKILLYGKEYQEAQEEGRARYRKFLNRIENDSLYFSQGFMNSRLYRITLERRRKQARRTSETDSLYWLDFYTRYGEIRRNEWVKDQKEERYAKDMRLDKMNISRLDSVVDGGADFKYYYTQNVPVDKNSKKLYLNIAGNVTDLKGARYDIPDTDTITYFVSSMVQFSDHAPRYKKKIIERRAVTDLSANILFEKNKSLVREDIGDNKAQLQRITDLIRQLDESGEFILDSIVITASSSPEGSRAHNGMLAHKRSLSLTRYFADKQNEDKRLNDFIKNRSIPENWDLLKVLIARDSTLTNRGAILRLIDSEPDADQRERLIRKQFGNEYSYMVEHFYPELRNTRFSFSMHRRGMVKDTIQTTEPDLEYAEALKKMENRRYKEALEVLINYDDRNTAICYMSMGYDHAAYGILENLAEDSDNEYLLAILSYRKGEQDVAVRHFLRSVELDESKLWRGALDPEIHILIGKYRLDERILK